jgi:hypothetical protein
MKTTSCSNFGKKGYVSYVTVLSLGLVLLTLMMASYRSAIRSHEVQKEITLRVDYSAKEEAVMRAIVPIAANRAMRCMQTGSDANDNARYPLRWQRIFRSAIDEASGSESISDRVRQEFGLADTVSGNAGDGLIWSSKTFRAFDDKSYAMPGTNSDFGAGFPVALETNSSDILSKDHTWPIISREKQYGSLSNGRVGAPAADYPLFNLIPYPDIRFGYAKPGDPFVAKHNWWAFKMNLSDHYGLETGLEKRDRDFILSIYEIPSQLAISAEAFTVLGRHADGSAWQNANISGGVFASRAKLENGMNLDWISGRRGLEFAENASIGDSTVSSWSESGWNKRDPEGNPVIDPFEPGVRERYETYVENFMPVSLASETGTAAFIPINRGVDYFDRYAHSAESHTISPTTWNDYTIGAIQCAMHLDITDVAGENNPTPKEFTFHYQKAGQKESMVINLEEGDDEGLPPGYLYVADENESVYFEEPVDVAYGKNGSYAFESEVQGWVTFENARFGDPAVGTFKAGYYRPSFPFKADLLRDTKTVVEVFPERFGSFLRQIGADGPEINHSLSVNVDYPGNSYIQKPSNPSTALDYGVVLRECGDLTAFSKGFSLVTNLRLYIGDNFNVVPKTPPSGSGIPEPFYPPASLFAPEKRYGAEYDPLHLKIGGQLGSLAGDSSTGESVHLLDMKTGSEREFDHGQLEVNLAPIRHPAALPPITMMNWLVVLRERRPEFHVGGSN